LALAIKAIFQSLKLFGILLLFGLIFSFGIGLQQYDIIDIKEFKQIGWIITFSVGIIIWFRLNASFIWKKLTGVYTINDINNDDN